MTDSQLPPVVPEHVCYCEHLNYQEYDGCGDKVPRTHGWGVAGSREWICGRCFAERSVEQERKRIVEMVKSNVPHDGHCALNDCTGCQIIDVLTGLINGE